MSKSDFIEPANIGNPEDILILEFARDIMELTGFNSEITYKELYKEDPQVRQPDIKRAKVILGWKPNFDRKEGLKKTLDYFKQKIAQPVA